MDYQVVIDDPYTAERVSRVYERFRWLEEIVGRRNYSIGKVDYPCGQRVKHIFSFKEKNHAMLFKLTWGGK